MQYLMSQRRSRLSLTFLFTVMMVLESPALSAPARNEIPQQGGIWNSRVPEWTFAPSEHQRLVESLRRITGLKQLGFNLDGSLVMGEMATPEGGSRLARAMLTFALESGAVFIIEDHSGSASVQFGQLDQGTNYQNNITGWRAVIWRVRIDPTDFRQIHAPRSVKASFDEGFTVMHEILHGLGYDDPREPGAVGECEELLNEVRLELGLPLRAEYFGTFFPIASGLATIRLRFQRKTDDLRRTRWRDDYLFFTVSPETSPESLFSCRSRSSY
ncbi:MAG: hypothetical protein ABI882_15375 [Acidobacteriota bacterium]